MFLGPTGYGVIAQLSNFQLMLNNILTLGVSVGLTAKVSEVYSTRSDEYISKINAYWSFFIKLIFLVSISATVTLLIFSDFFAQLLIGNNEYKLIFSIIVLSLPLSTANVIIDSFLKSFGAISTIVRLSIYTSIISLIVLIPLLFYFNIIGVSLNIIILSLTPLLVFLILFRKKFFEFFKTGSKSILNKSEKFNVFKIGFIAVMAAFMHQGAILVIRRLILSEFGEFENGLYQSVLGLSLNYFAVVYALLSNYTLPKFSSMLDNPSLVAELNNNFRFLWIIIIPAIILIFSYREWVIQIIYSGEFLKAQGLFMYQLIGDIFRMLAALFGLWLIPRMKIVQSLSIDFIFNLTLIFLPYFLITQVSKDLQMIPLAYMSAFFLHFTLYLLYSIKNIKFRFTKENLTTILFGVIFIGFAMFFSNQFQEIGHLIMLPLVFAWFFIAFSKNERVSITLKAKSLHKSKKK